jgi:hypothetical protein
VFSAGLLARSQFASGRSCDRPTRSRFSVVFLGPRANAELVHKFHVALHASHAAFPMVTSKFFALTQPVNPPNAKKKLNFNSTVYMLTLTRRTNGQCLGTFKTDNKFCPPPIVSLTTTNFSS